MRHHLLGFSCMFLALAGVPGCDNDPTEASVVNDVPGATIEKTWFRSTLFAGLSAEEQADIAARIFPGEELAIAASDCGSP